MCTSAARCVHVRCTYSKYSAEHSSLGLAAVCQCIQYSLVFNATQTRCKAQLHEHQHQATHKISAVTAQSMRMYFLCTYARHFLAVVPPAISPSKKLRNWIGSLAVAAAALLLLLLLLLVELPVTCCFGAAAAAVVSGLAVRAVAAVMCVLSSCSHSCSGSVVQQCNMHRCHKHSNFEC
jgi:hypothetical protein